MSPDGPEGSQLAAHRLAAGGAETAAVRPPPRFVYSTHCHLYLREGEQFRIWMNPILYMRQDAPAPAELTLTESERRRLLISLFQERMRKLLYIFLHGHALPELARVFFALGDRSADRVAVELRALDFLATELRDFPDIALPETRRALRGLLVRSRPTARELARGLAAFHRELGPIFAEEGRGGLVHRVEAMAPFDEREFEGPDARFLRPLVELSRQLRREAGELLRGAYLYGSMASRDYVPGFSDTELLLLVRREASGDEAALLRLREIVTGSMRHLYRLDPFQHHGHFVASEFDLDFYPQSFLPVVILGSCRAMLGGSEPLVLRERDSCLERRRDVWDLCYLSRRLYLEGRRPRNFYEWKAHLGAVLHIPTIFLAARGTYVLKRDSFARAAPDLPAESWDIIERATALRREWTGGPRLGGLARRGLPARAVPSFWPWMSGHAGGRPRDAHGTSGHEGVRRAFHFSEAVLAKLREEGVL